MKCWQFWKKQAWISGPNLSPKHSLWVQMSYIIVRTLQNDNDDDDDDDDTDLTVEMLHVAQQMVLAAD